ncbi:hypothetical protein R1flu_025051 [Riccia fluitans]|uniref:Uncharacterized protein n=1 Tax=Riccia fluitans TaxID=41844 RepID=A0ABD1XWP4_9MARC
MQRSPQYQAECAEQKQKEKRTDVSNITDCLLPCIQIILPFLDSCVESPTGRANQSMDVNTQVRIAIPHPSTSARLITASKALEPKHQWVTREAADNAGRRWTRSMASKTTRLRSKAANSDVEVVSTPILPRQQRLTLLTDS